MVTLVYRLSNCRKHFLIIETYKEEAKINQKHATNFAQMQSLKYENDIYLLSGTHIDNLL